LVGTGFTGLADNGDRRTRMSNVLDAQKQYWDKNFSERPEMSGDVPSDPAQKASELLKREGKTALLELGCGRGRDTLFFARNGLHVTALDYSDVATNTVTAKAEESGVGQRVRVIQHDLRESLPFEDGTFDAAFSHMLFCMAITNAEAERLSKEVWRVLNPVV
jgi:SAM-dependent methyltransferase